LNDVPLSLRLTLRTLLPTLLMSVVLRAQRRDQVGAAAACSISSLSADRNSLNRGGFARTR
jgi:hypothetical protein